MHPRIVIVVGTRPEAIKLAPLVHALTRRQAPLELLMTGQHPLDPAEWGLEGVPAIQLGCPGGDHPRRHADELARRIGPATSGAELIMVQGDTSSALGGALAGVAAGIPVAHVEAGLRTFDPAMPWPEELFRVAIDARAALLFAPTSTSAANLRREGVAGRIHVSGNTAIDALFARLSRLAPAVPPPGPPRVLVTCHRRENWGAAQHRIAAALAALARRGDVIVEVVLHPNPRVATLLRDLLADEPRIRLLPPLGHDSMLVAMRGARLILSDSGGIQEEAPALGVPLLVLRDKTERPEAIATGNMLLVGTDTARILGAASRLLSDPAAHAAMATPALPYGDGRSGERIAALIEEWRAARTSGGQRRRRA